MSRFKTLITMAVILCASTVSANESGTVLITGANRGIGLEFARQYAADGWQVIGTARKPDAATELQDLDVQVLQLDVTDQISVDQLAATLAGRPIDVLINNAGIGLTSRSIADIKFDKFNYVMAVNTVGPIRVTQALLPNLRAGQFKKVINMTSVLGSIAGNTTGSLYGYRESKAALNMFTRSLAAELGEEGFICIAMHPGWVQTDLGGAGATTPVQASVTGIRTQVANLRPSDNGRFLTFESKSIAW